MSDRTTRLTVVLDASYRTDDIQAMCDAIKLFAGVVDVKANVTSPGEWSCQQRAEYELREKILAVFRSKP